jgi:Rrf2 family protein
MHYIGSRFRENDKETMFNISKASEYAILFLTQLAKNKKPEPINLEQITSRTGLPYKFLSRIVLQLKKAGLIKSIKGAGGGYQLAKKPAQITLRQIIDAVEPKVWFVSCMNGKCALEKSCHHKQIWMRLQNKLNLEMEKVKLSDLL